MPIYDKMFSSLMFLIVVFIFTCLSPLSARENTKQFNTNQDTGFYYTIKKGDTLWELSQKFYNSQWDWPGLWELNRDIKNPHWIYPGNTIRVYLKPELKKQPTLEVDEHPDPVDAILLCSEDNNVLINDYRIAFINKGAEDNIQSGNIYTIKRGKETESIYDVQTGLDIAPVTSGRLVVLHTEPASATVMVLSSIQDIHPGDIVN